MSRTISASVFTLLLISLTFVACERGEYKTPVDSTVRSQYDATPRPTVDAGRPTESSNAPVAIPETSEAFVPPPNRTITSPISDERARFVGKDGVRLWIWNSKGSAQLFLAEGEKASIPAVGRVLEVNAIGGTGGGRVYFILDGKQLPILKNREQVKIGDTYVFVSEILLNDVQE